MSCTIPDKQLAAIYTGVGQIEIKEIPVELPQEDFCLIKVNRCGVCGSDLHTYRGQSMRNTFENWMKLGFADGHEYVGTVVAVGPLVEHIKVGMRVVAECTRHCGVCPSCKRGLYNTCISRKDLVWKGNGGFAQFATAPEHALFEIPDIITDAQAVLIEPAACALRALNRSNFTLGDSVLIIGGGTIGLLCAAIAKNVCNLYVSLVYKYECQKKIAQSIGLSDIFFVDTELSEIADIVIDAVGTENSFNMALAAVRRNGTIVLVGSPTGLRNIKMGTIVGKELTIKGALTYARNGSTSDFERTIRLISDGIIDPTPIVTHEYALQDIKKAFITALDKSMNCIKVQIIH